MAKTVSAKNAHHLSPAAMTQADKTCKSISPSPSSMKTCTCAYKTTERSEALRRQLIHRLNRIEGQIRGIRNMVEHDAYCPDILTQCAAANAALNAFNRDLVAQHIRSCVTRDIKNGNDDVVDELVRTLQKLMK